MRTKVCTNVQAVSQQSHTARPHPSFSAHIPVDMLALEDRCLLR